MQKLVPRGPNAIFPYIIREITGTCADEVALNGRVLPN